jgi:predicted phosphodiesterase
MLRRFTFQYFSDVHLERRRVLPRIEQIADHLILAGDIGHPRSEIYKLFLAECSRRFDQIYLVHGNHEWDRGPPPKQYPWPNVHLLENRGVLLNERLRIAGSTLWTPSVCARRNTAAVRFFQEEIRKSYEEAYPLVCVSHHLPSFHMIDAQYKRYPNLHRFANNLDTFFLFEGAPHAWICGHSHSVLTRRIGRTQCLLNAHADQNTTKFEVLL